MGKWIARGVYALVKTALMVAVVSLPTSKLWKKPTHWSPWIELASAVVLASIAYMQLQGSDPGYLREELLWKEENNSTEEQLLTNEDDDESLNGSDDESVALQIRSHSGLDVQKQYRLDKIRRIQETLRALEKHSSEDSTDGTDGKASTHPSSMTAMEFCEHCDLFPPLRSHHCRPCGRCVATFDHHCFVLATCIGEKNHCRFWWFLFLETCEILAGLDVVYSSFRPASIKHTWIHANIYGFLLTTLLLILLLFVGSLLAFHTFVAMTSTTSYEFGADHVPYLDGFHDCDLPFSRGLFHNLNSFCCKTRKTTFWIPTRWLPPAPVDRDGDKVCENIWENKYYSCC